MDLCEWRLLLLQGLSIPDHFPEPNGRERHLLTGTLPQSVLRIHLLPPNPQAGCVLLRDSPSTRGFFGVAWYTNQFTPEGCMSSLLGWQRKDSGMFQKLLAKGLWLAVFKLLKYENQLNSIWRMRLITSSKDDVINNPLCRGSNASGASF